MRRGVEEREVKNATFVEAREGKTWGREGEKEGGSSRIVPALRPGF